MLRFVFRRPQTLAWATLAGLSATLPACTDDDASSATPKYEVEIRRTTNGVAHITGADLPSVAYGSGYAVAEDHGCTIAEQILKVRSERASFWGAGESDVHLNSDLAYKHIGVYQKAAEHFDELPEDVRETIVAYAAGYNAYLKEVGAEGFPGSCAGEAWVREIDEIDLYAYFRELALLGSGRQLLDFIATAQPPGSQQFPAPPLDKIKEWTDSPFGSNGWGIGSELSATGGGMLLANPHFPWEGELRLWESHLTIPGELNVYGAGLIGVPVVLIGFNDAVAWTHTVSAGNRFTFYRLDLVPGNPTAYMREGQEVEMSSETYSVDVRNDDGSTRTVTRTLYRTEYGPVLNVSPFSWTSEFTFTYRDANIDNTQLISQFLAMNRATSMDEFQAAHRDNLGIPWVNTMSTSADGRAWYIDSTPTPNLSDEAITAMDQRLDDGDFFAVAFDSLGAVLLEASTSRDDWVEVPGARSPGLVPWDRLPQLERSDFIFNANDSHWMTNPEELLEGYSPLHGRERTPRSVRTRMNAITLMEGAGGFAGDDGKFDLAELQAAALSNRGLSAELLRDDLVARCTATSSVDVDGATVDLGPACTVLANWDLRLNLDSVGAVVFREFIGDYTTEQTQDRGALFATPFDPNDPVNTPRDLAPPLPDRDRSLEALGRAVQRLGEAGIAIDATLGDAQFTKKGDLEIPIHGGGRLEGVTNLITYSTSLYSARDPAMPRGEVINSSTGLTDEGYVVNYGTSFIMTVAYTDEGPEAAAFVTYGQSEDPNSPWFSDQTQAFSDKAWRPVAYTEADIAADPNLTTKTLVAYE